MADTIEAEAVAVPPVLDVIDALEWLRSRPDSSCDLVFGSPPYSGKGARYPGRSENLAGKDWARWMASVVTEGVRVCAGLVCFVVDAGVEDHAWDPAVIHLMAMLDDSGIVMARPGIYYRNGIPGNRADLRNDYELIVRAKRPGPLPFVDLGACASPPKFGPGGSFSNRTPKGARQKKRPYSPPEKANPGNVLQDVYTADEVAQRLLLEHSSSGDCPYLTNGGGHLGSRLAHKSVAPFSQRLADFYVRTFCPVGGVVADVFYGSGTVAAACAASGRRFAGCDDDPQMREVVLARLGLVRGSGEP